MIKLRNNGRLIGIAALLCGVICWGVTPVILRRLTPFIDGWTANGIRYPMAALLYWPLLFYAHRSGQFTAKLVGKCAIPAILALGGQVFWALGHYELQASEIGFLVRLSMAWAIVGSMILFRDERRLLARRGFYFGLMMIVAGFLVMSTGADVAALEGVEPSYGIPPGNHSLGVLWMLFCGMFFGLYMVSVRLCIPDVEPMLAFGVVAQIVSLGLIVGMFVAGDVTTVANQPAISWTLMIASSFLGIAIGHIVMYTAIHQLGAAITSSCQTLMPFVTAAVASHALAESLNLRQWTGGIVMVVGAITLLSLKHVISTRQIETAGESLVRKGPLKRELQHARKSNLPPLV